MNPLTKLVTVPLLLLTVSSCGKSDSANLSGAVMSNPGNLATVTGPVAITSVNGTYGLQYGNTIQAHPGDVITLSADILDQARGYQASYTPLEAFSWSSDFSPSDHCDPSLLKDCLAFSNFSVNNYGVAYYVPSNIARKITITVSLQGHPENYSNFIIINDDYRTVGYTPPSGIVTDPTQYHQSQLDPTIALNGQGQWLYVNGVRYWSPYVYLIGNEDDWSPYRHGYWTMDSSHQTVTWISFDPWGWMTDHYGFWRFHGVYGWLWAPFAGSDFVYHAHCATWIDDGSANVGWFPYFNSYAYGYRDGADQGFADGFWLGYKVGANYGQSGYAYHPGFTIVPVGQFTQGDIDSVYLHINNNPLVVMVVAQASTSNYFAAAPRTQILSKLGIIPNTSLSTGSAGLQYAVAIHSIPPRYTQVIATISTARNAPVGSVIDARGAATVNLILPTINGRGVAMAPIGRDSQGQVATLPPQTVRVAVANPNNPVVITRTNATPPVPPVGSSTNHPVLQNPTRPTPAPTTTPRPTMTPYNASKFSMLSILKDQQHQ